MAEMTDIALEGRQDQPKEYPVLWWTLWFGETVEEGRIIDKCGLPYTCKFTLDRTKYDDAKVIVVHASSFEFDFPYVNDVKSGKKALVLNTGPGTLIHSILTKPMYTIQEKNAFRKELAPVAWIVSSCRAKNGRHLYVTQLLKYIKVDVYGHCMSNKAWPKHPDGREFTDREVVGRYKFYLSIENSNCNDYVTEKLERPYVVGV
ncbi:Alpha 1,3 fucosyltransferase, partial [Linnemannia gamsii]